ncbi:MAG: hypothetical protein JW854_12315 [Actinobacteria bacterium]|nr:hypothetical protein [Actinomycetota bacterium]
MLSRAFAYAGPSSLPALGKLSRSKNPKVRGRAREVAEKIKRETAEPLSITMLGTFEVARGGKTITSGDWRSKKALAVMKYLAAQEEKRLAPREVLMELLWPESTPEAA